MGILFKHFNLHEELNMTEDDTKNQTNRGISETVQVMFPHHFSRSYKVDVRMDLHKDLQDEIDALVKLGQTGVHTVKRSQAFKDTRWDPQEAFEAMDFQWILVSLDDGHFEETLKHGYSSAEIEILKKSPEKELETLEWWIRDNATEDEYSYPSCLIESLRSSEGQECGLFIEFYRSVWDHSGTVDDCRWVVFPSREELDLFFLRKNQFVCPGDGRLNKDLLRKWNEENREFWKKLYEYHEK